MGFLSTTSASSAIIVAIAVTQYMTTGSVPYNNTGQNMSLLIYLVSDRDMKSSNKWVHCIVRSTMLLQQKKRVYCQFNQFTYSVNLIPQQEQLVNLSTQLSEN